MSTPRDTVLALVEKSKMTWDFDVVSAELSNAVEAVQLDGTLAEMSKRPLINIANVALKALEERRRSPQHLQHALAGLEGGSTSLSDEQADQLAAWFFRIAYSGSHVTPEIERLVRPILARTTKNQNPVENERRFRISLENYRRLAEWGTDLGLSENNLNGMIIAVRVSPLRPAIADEFRARCEQALSALQKRKRLSTAELAKESLAECRALIAPTWQRFSRGENCFLEQQDTKALHTCLFGLLNSVLATEELADSAQEMTEEINLLRSQFEQIRYPSSTTLLARFEKEIQNLEHEVAATFDFGALKLDVAALQRRIQQSGRVKRGTPGWMHQEHMERALAETSELYEKILQKERDHSQLEAEIRMFETDISKLESPEIPLTAIQIKRLQARAAKDAPLVRWISACFESQADRNRAWSRIEGIKSRLKELWIRMESQQEQRVVEFQEQCLRFDAEIRTSIQLRQTLSELRELERAITEFTAQKQPELRKLIDGLVKTFRLRAADAVALRRLTERILDDINDAHRRIFSPIDFDGLNARVVSAKQWLDLGLFSDVDRQQLPKDIAGCFGEIRRLRFRQEKVRAERQAKADALANELHAEIAQVSAEASANPGSQESWRALVEMDGQLTEDWRFLTDSHRQALRREIDAGFEKIRAARVAFAAEAAKVFAQYNEILADALFTLEEDASKEAAFEAIERIKPVRRALKDEKRLLKRQRDELITLLRQISASIDEVFDQVNAQATQEYNRIRADIDRLDDEIKKASDWQTADALFEKCKQLSGQIQSTDLSIAARKECRAEIERLFEDVKERRQAFRFTRAQTEDVDSMLTRLERLGHLMFVRNVPRIV